MENRVTEKSKKSFYLLVKYIKEMETEALRLDRSVSWIIQRAWIEGREKIKNYQSIDN